MKNDLQEKVRAVLMIIIVVAVLANFGYIPQEWSDAITPVLFSVIAGLVISFAAEKIVESFSGTSLKKILIPIEIHGFKFSISVFAITTIVVKIWIL